MKKFTLNNEPKIETGFTTPENYFVDFSESILSKVSFEQPKVISFSQKIKQNKKWIFSAAAILVVSFSSIVYYSINNQNRNAYNTELENYITNHYSYSDDEIVSLLETSQIEKIIIKNEIKNENIEQSLLENTDLEQIITD